MQNRGGQNRLSVEDQLLLTLMYCREYRTQFHIGLDFGVSSTVCRITHKVETVLVRSGQFRLPGKHQLSQSHMPEEVAVFDVAEMDIERPKKNNGLTIVANESSIPLKLKLPLTLKVVNWKSASASERAI